MGKITITIPKEYTRHEYTGETLPYGKYLVVRIDGKTHFEVYNGTGWAYNNKVIAYYYLPAISES